MKVKIKNSIKKLTVYIKCNCTVLLLITAFFTGVISGSYIYTVALKGSEDILNQFSQNLSADQSVLTAFINCTTINLIYYLTILFSGLSLAGQYILYFVPFIKGLTYGYTSSFIYSVFGSNGFIINLAGILPQTVIVCILLIIACKAGINLSKKVQKQQNSINLRQFVLLHFLLFSASIVASLGDVFITNTVIKLFL